MWERRFSVEQRKCVAVCTFAVQSDSENRARIHGRVTSRDQIRLLSSRAIFRDTSPSLPVANAVEFRKNEREVATIVGEGANWVSNSILEITHSYLACVFLSYFPLFLVQWETTSRKTTNQRQFDVCSLFSLKSSEQRRRELQRITLIVHVGNCRNHVRVVVVLTALPSRSTREELVTDT